MSRRDSAAALSLREPDLFSYQPAEKMTIDPAPVSAPSAPALAPQPRLAAVLPTGVEPPGFPADPEPLSIPLTDEAFGWIRAGEKNWEVRRRGRQFNETEVAVGRAVRMKRGFRADDAIAGAIEQVVEAADVAALFANVPYRAVIPVAESVEEAVAIANRLLGPGAAAVIGFRIEIEHHAGTDCETGVGPAAQAKAPQPARGRRKPAR